jgi:hypothetical protein
MAIIFLSATRNYDESAYIFFFASAALHPAEIFFMKALSDP